MRLSRAPQPVTARKVGCDERTIRRWLTDVPGFREYVAHCREMLTDEEPLAKPSWLRRSPA